MVTQSELIETQKRMIKMPGTVLARAAMAVVTRVSEQACRPRIRLPYVISSSALLVSNGVVVQLSCKSTLEN